jgi:hypothetical protein
LVKNIYSENYYVLNNYILTDHLDVELIFISSMIWKFIIVIVI